MSLLTKSSKISNSSNNYVVKFESILNEDLNSWWLLETENNNNSNTMLVVKNVTRRWAYITLISALFNILLLVNCDDGFCPLEPSESDDCGSNPAIEPSSVRYILYGVNNPEGFNLRRDVYMRMAVFLNKLNKNGSGHWRLVLPPWDHLYHWQSTDIEGQHQLPWGFFFDVQSMKQYAPVVELYELFDELTKQPELKKNLIMQVFVLQHFKDAWTENKIWEDKWSVEPCPDSLPYIKTKIKNYVGPFWGYENITAEKVNCVSFQGPASQLGKLLETTTATTIMFDHAEIAFHDLYGQAEYWKARRSMRFSSKLISIANSFRENYLNSSDEKDGTVLPSDWTKESSGPNPAGGPYLAIHLRRKDFLWGRAKEVPTIELAAQQIKILLSNLKLAKVFIATDATKTEFQELKALSKDFEVYRFEPSVEIKNEIKDGGVAIVDQIICSRAAYFSGTYESTFSFRIQEEREILGFDRETTFNRLCGENSECAQPTRWKIVY